MKIGVVIPTLGDRPEFLKFCLKRVNEQTRKPDCIALVNYKNRNGKIDIAQRYKTGIKYLIDKGCDLIVFIEDDDYYPKTYIEETYNLWVKYGRPDIIGCKETVYYHLPTSKYLTTIQKHCSAYCTAISKKAVYEVCGDYEAYYDVKLWAKNKGNRVEYDNKPIGIKHGIGKCGGSGHNPRQGFYRFSDPNHEYLKSSVDSEALALYDRMFNPALVNIITRTHDRKLHFLRCKQSIDSQTYKNINHIVGTDTACDYYDNAISLQKKQPVGERPKGCYNAPYNLHLNELANHVKSGWVMYLDDDDMFNDESSLAEIVNNIHSDNDLLLWKVDINGHIVPKELGKIICGDVSGIGFMFNSKHLPVDWGCWSQGDFRVINELSKKLNRIWIDKVLTRTQGKPNHGRAVA